MLGVYAFSAILGGGLVVFSAVGGALGHGDVGSGGAEGDLGGGHGFGHQGAESEGTGHGPAETLHASGGKPDVSAAGALWLPLRSLRFWTYALGMFGSLGLLLTLTNASTEPFTGLIAGACGLAMGYVATFVVAALGRPEDNSLTTSDDVLGVEARVTVGIRGDAVGKVRASVKGEVIDLLAHSEGGFDIAAGEEVYIIGVEGDAVRVARKEHVLGIEVKP